VQISGLHHVALNVLDVDAAVRFYTDVLGFELLDTRPDFGFDGAWLQAGANQVHLLGAPDAMIDIRQHYALKVDDAEAWALHIESKGLKCRRSMYVPGAGRQVFVKDPSGNSIELNQPDHP
jgi:catechol 2,3-dioxygenase-like lactoylglutathione lyase family enzyme